MRQCGFKHTEETKRKMSEKARGRVFAKEVIDRISATKKAKHYHLSEEAKKNLSLKLKGRIISEETRKKMSKSQKGKIRGPLPESVKLKLSEVLSGRVFTEEHKNKISIAATGRVLSYDTRIKLSRAKKGSKFNLSDEQRRKRSESRSGEKNPSWKGGLSFEPYNKNWTDTLKKSIRERDGYICRICGLPNSKTVHHIDYNKKNCCPDNLITLCHPCHSKTSFKREHWMNFFKEIV